MGLITRQGKGSKLTIEELDGNLTYLEGLVSLYKKTVSSNIDWSEASMQEIEINEKTNFDFTGATTGQTLSLILDAKKAALITWPESIQWTTDINQLDLNYTISYTDVGTGFNSDVYSITIQSDGKIFVGGSFTSYNGVSANRIIRLNSDGSIDTSFVIGTGFNDVVNSIAIQDDGKILVGGGFTSYNGVSANRIIRLNSDGSKDESFDTGTGFNDYVYSIVIQDDGKILVGGGFAEYNVESVNTLIRLNTDGSIDTSFDMGVSFNNVVFTLVLQSDGKLLVGTASSTINIGGFSYETENRLIRLNTDGTVDISFNLFLFDNYGEQVYSIAIQSDGKILVGGSFTEYNGVSANNIIRLNSDGSVDESFNTGTGFNDYVYSYVNTIAIQDDDKILVGGEFTSYNGVSANNIIRLNSDGSVDESFFIDNNFTNINTIAIQSSNVYIGGTNIILSNINYEQAYEICNFYYNGTYYIGESTI